MRYWVAVWMLAAYGIGAIAQSPAPTAVTSSANSTATTEVSVSGGTLHGVVKSGNIPLPGVSVTAQNTLTGKRYSTTTDITGAWSMTIPQNGRYVIRTQFAAFAPGSQEAVLNATGHDRTVNFELILASRAAEQDRAQAQQNGGQNGQGEQSAEQQIIQQLTGNGAGNLSLTSTLNEGTEAGNGPVGANGAELPSIAANSDFGGESVAITGQTGQVSPLAGVDMDELRDRIEAYRQQNGGQMPGSGGLFSGGGFGGGGFGGGPGGFGGGGFGGWRGRGGGGRGNFRGFNPGQPHGAIFWDGNNSIFNAQPFALLGQQQQQPSNGSNRFGLTFMSAPYIPHLTKPSGKDTIFLSLSGTRQSTPYDEYAFLPTDAERQGDFSASGLPLIYDPTTLQQFTSNGVPNVIPLVRIQNQPGYALLNCPAATPNCQPLIPEPNLTGASAVRYNYHLLTTGQSNSTQAGIRYNRSIGANAGQFRGGRGGFGGFGRRSQNQGLRQSINFNFNTSRSASDNVSYIPILGGKSASDSYSLQAGYTVGYHRFTSIFNTSWNRSNSHSTNFFTNTANNIDSTYGIAVPNNVALNYGLPSIQLSEYTGVNEQQPSFSISQTISISEVLSWIHNKHNLRFGGDYRRVHRDFLAGSNATGSFVFSGLFTEDAAQDESTGSAIADLLLGLPQSTSLNSSLARSYLRDNVVDAFAMDDWRALPSLTLNYGVRYEFFAPYTEKFGHLAEVATSPEDGFKTQTEVQSGAAGLPASLVYPWHKAFSPRIALAWRVPKIKQTVIRAGFGTNYTVGEYATFASLMAHQPPFTNQQTNQEANGNAASSACARAATPTCFTLANGFPTPATLGNYALDPHYGLPYLMAWNLDIQKSLPWEIVLNIGYNGTRANHLDTVIAPRAIPSSPLTDPSICQGSSCYPLNFRYEEAASFSKFNAGTVRVNKRLSKGLALGANYQYSHSIDDAAALGSVGGVGVQNWQNILGELGNSSLDVRHSVSGTYLYELPFGSDKTWVTTGVGSHILEGFSVSGQFKFATGTWLSPSYTSSVASTACGTGGVMRPNLTGVSVTTGGGSLHQWFNPAAYSAPANTVTPTQTFCDFFGNAPRNSILGPGTVSNSMALSKTMQLGDTRSMEVRATINNAFNTVQ
ncbi:MAG TPA: TonB-dependent receptor, partial [Terracidiphilus sp.]|nr:TonB-dependent receptor [Terracidiphilus sp.]